MAAGTPAPAVAVPAATPPALQMQLSQISNFTPPELHWMKMDMNDNKDEEEAAIPPAVNFAICIKSNVPMKL